MLFEENLLFDIGVYFFALASKGGIINVELEELQGATCPAVIPYTEGSGEKPVFLANCSHKYLSDSPWASDTARVAIRDLMGELGFNGGKVMFHGYCTVKLTTIVGRCFGTGVQYS
jgi:hypothetical protein